MMTSAEIIRLMIECGIFIVGGYGLLFRIGRMTEKFVQIGNQQSHEITALKDETSALKKTVERISDLMIALTKLDGRIDRIEDRQLAQGKRFDELEKRFQRHLDANAGSS